MMNIQAISKHKTFDGETSFYSHDSVLCGSEMKFGVFQPRMKSFSSRMPGLIWLSGLTCTDQNFLTKAGAQKMADQLGIILFAPDTSPRNLGIPGEKERYDLGEGASFYLDATQLPWSKNYLMESYISKEFYDLCFEHFPVSKMGIFGHSMGGHGALTLAMRHPDRFLSVSAFAPICAPTECDWGINAFKTYLGESPSSWRSHDASILAEKGYNRPILIDQGEKDEFYEKGFLKPERFKEACELSGIELNLRMQKGFDHSYYFISSFIDEHLIFHAGLLSV